VAVKVAEVQNTKGIALSCWAAFESAVQLGRGDKGNRQAEMANPTKCGDSQQVR
jgi:hypothetical protein